MNYWLMLLILPALQIPSFAQEHQGNGLEDPRTETKPKEKRPKRPRKQYQQQQQAQKARPPKKVKVLRGNEAKAQYELIRTQADALIQDRTDKCKEIVFAVKASPHADQTCFHFPNRGRTGEYRCHTTLKDRTTWAQAIFNLPEHKELCGGRRAKSDSD